MVKPSRIWDCVSFYPFELVNRILDSPSVILRIRNYTDAIVFHDFEFHDSY